MELAIGVVEWSSHGGSSAQKFIRFVHDLSANANALGCALLLLARDETIIIIDKVHIVTVRLQMIDVIAI